MMVNIAPTLMIVLSYRVPTLHSPRIWPPIAPTRASIAPTATSAKDASRELKIEENAGGSAPAVDIPACAIRVGMPSRREIAPPPR